MIGEATVAVSRITFDATAIEAVAQRDPTATSAQSTRAAIR